MSVRIGALPEFAHAESLVVGDLTVLHQHDHGARNLSLGYEALEPGIDARETVGDEGGRGDAAGS
ncbi:MAG: hypothetical protein ACLGIK_04345 [Gemmatimonadota bacterium]